MVVPSLPSSPPSGGKGAIRDRLRAERRAYARSLSSETRGALEQDLADVLAPEWLRAKVVAAYQPMKEEIDPTAALTAAEAAGCRAVLPAFVERDSRMTFHPGPASEPGPWGILQPSLASPPVTPDLLLVPLLGVDRSGNRVGQGKGHYDRALAALRSAGPVRLIGIGWPMQLLGDALVPDAWDVPLDAFASPDGLVGFS